MRNFRAICAKNGQKVELIIRYETLEEAREWLHTQGYSIVELKETQEIVEEGQKWVNTYYFDIVVDGKKKSGQIQSMDLFHAYIKLVDDLHYTVTSIYSNPTDTEDERALATGRIRASYAVYREQNTDKNTFFQKAEETRGQEKKESASASDISSTVIGKELAVYYGLLDRVLSKIEYILTRHSQDIGDDRRNKLQSLHLAIKQLKNTTNIDKLRLVSESALIKIGELELELVRKTKDSEKQEFINETNKLLRQFGSHQKIRNPDTDVYLKIQRIAREFFEQMVELTKSPEGESGANAVSEQKIDTSSFSYYKNLRELNIYKKKRDEVNKELFLAIISFNFEKQRRLRLKKKLILQNISLGEKRTKNSKFSYTRIVKGLEYYSDIFVFFIHFIASMALYATFLLSIVYMVSATFRIAELNYSAVYAVCLLSLFCVLVRATRTFIFSLVSLGIYAVFVFFVQINF